jgi:hypothetical protein
MGKKQLSIHVRGNSKEWSFTFLGDPRCLAEWRADGLEIDEVLNTIPTWVPASMIRPWCIVQDIVNFKWPWA